jgi:methylthioribose-1-phosphate isomerase
MQLNTTTTPTVKYDEAAGAILITDQTLLPGEVRIIELRTMTSVWDAIRKLQVRGAPAIGVTAAHAMALAALQVVQTGANCSGVRLIEYLRETGEYLKSSRPTAVNLAWAVDRMMAVAETYWIQFSGKDNVLDAGKGIADALSQESALIASKDTEACRAIGEYGLTLLKSGMTILTHCNAGRLAATAYGTATAPVYVGLEKGISLKVYCDETRPLLQGARLTAFELMDAGVDTTLICDNMASHMMAKGLIDAVFTGCDRVAANGDTANKIGTLSVAVNAHYHGIPFYICAPLSTIDPKCAQGADILIEERAPEEVTDFWYAHPMAPSGVKVANPSFDVTPAELISAIITERGIVYPPYPKSIAGLFASCG